jgi:glycerol-3-phosphate O-acyltransferase
LKGEVEILIRQLIANGAHIHIPRADQDYAIEVGLRMLLLRHFVLEESGLYRANPAEEIMLRYYANAIAHLLRDRATATSLAAE